MGFNIGAAITGALGGFLVGGPTGAVVGGVAGGVIGGGSKASKQSFATVPQTEQAQIARSELFGLATGELPEVPLRGVAKLPPVTEERRLARSTAKELIQPQDFLSLPEVQAIIFEATEKGDLLTNRISRALQATGTITSTPGRDILGRAVTDVQKSITSSLAPFAAEERARRERLIPTLEALGITDEELSRATTQAELDALFNQKITELNLQTGLRPRLLESVIGLQPAVQPIIEGAQPSSITEFAPLIGPLLGELLKK